MFVWSLHGSEVDSSSSTFVPKQPGKNTESLSVAPMDTTLLGMDKSVSSQSSYDPIVELPTPVEQEDITQWPGNLDPTAGFPLELHDGSASLPRSATKGFQAGVSHQPDRTGYVRRNRGADWQQSIRHGSKNMNGEGQSRSESASEQQKKQSLGISNKPQTKAEQQRFALKKLSRAVSKDSSTDVDLEKAVLRILAGTTDATGTDSEESESAQGSTRRSAQSGGSNVFLSKSEAIKAAQAISNLIKQSPGSAYAQPRKSSQNFGANPKVCELCDYAVARACDLKKHMKRHEKPYGCTYPKCHKRFGAKSDWKRHENSQHFQLEAYRCSQPLSSGKICGEHFFRIEHFKKHLETQHKVDSADEQVLEAKRRRIGKNCQQQFWCGFHGDIVELKEKRNAAWDERFDHIAFHFEKEKKSIETWICVEENKSKKELLKEMDRYVFDDEQEAPPPPPPPPMSGLDIAPPPPGVPPPAAPVQVQNPRKRSAPAEPTEHNWSHKKHHSHRDQHIRAGDSMIRFCVSNLLKKLGLQADNLQCQCHDGPGNLTLQPSCMECNHTYCAGCHNS